MHTIIFNGIQHDIKQTISNCVFIVTDLQCLCVCVRVMAGNQVLFSFREHHWQLVFQFRCTALVCLPSIPYRIVTCLGKIVISEYLDYVSYFLLWVEITANLISNESVWLHSPVLISIRLICENEPPCFIMKNNHIFCYVAPHINKYHLLFQYGNCFLPTLLKVSS